MGFPTWQSWAEWLLSTVRHFGLEAVFRRYYGTYRAFVEDVEDPDGRGRVRLRVPALGHRKAPPDIWAHPVFPGGTSEHGMFFPPKVEDLVWAQFEAGNPDKPLYVGGFIKASGAPSEYEAINVLKRGIRTPIGHLLLFSDDTDDLHIVLQTNDGQSVNMDKDGGISILTRNGSRVFMDNANSKTTIEDSSGTKIEMDNSALKMTSAQGSVVQADGQFKVTTSGNVTLDGGAKCIIQTGFVDIGDGAAQGVVLGTNFLQLFNLHSHIGNMGIPTTPAAAGPAGPMLVGTHVSVKVKTA